MWPLRLIEHTPDYNGRDMQVGDCFFYNPPADYDHEADPDGWYWIRHLCRDICLSDYYRQNNSNRPPLLVVLPGKTLFCVDGACWRTSVPGGKIEYYGGWQVTGDAPAITVMPSINIVGSYHGWIQNGTITPDCEGRHYDEHGRRT